MRKMKRKKRRVVSDGMRLLNKKRIVECSEEKSVNYGCVKLCERWLYMYWGLWFATPIYFVLATPPIKVIKYIVCLTPQTLLSGHI